MTDRFTTDAWWQATCINLRALGYDAYANVLTILKPQPRNWYVLGYLGTQASWEDSVYKNSKVFTPYIIVEASSASDARCRLAFLEPDITIDWFSEIDSWGVGDLQDTQWEPCFVNLKDRLSYPYIVTLFHANDMVQHVKMEE